MKEFFRQWDPRIGSLSVNPYKYASNAAHTVSGGRIGADWDLVKGYEAPGGVRQPSKKTNPDPNPPQNQQAQSSNQEAQIQSWLNYGSGSGGGGGYSAQAASDAKAKADAIAQYDETIRSANDAMAGLGHQQSVGEQNINQDINRQRNKLDANFNQSRGLYDMNTNDAITNNRNTRQQIAENAREQTRGLQQIFAAGGAGDSSFSKIVAPFEVGKAATRQQSAVQDAYAKNRRDLDINWNNVKNAYDENVNELNANRENRLNRLRAEVEGARNDLAEKIRQANIGKSTANGQGLAAAIASQDGARREINDRRNNITNLGKDVAVAMKDVGWKAPKLESYADKATGVEVRTGNADQAGLQDQLSPNLQSLLDQDKKKREMEA